MRTPRLPDLVRAASLLALSSALASASDIYVDDDAAGGDGSSWSEAFRYLQDALVAAQPGDRILIAGGLYRPDVGGGQQLFDITATFTPPDDGTLEGGYRGLAGGGDPNDRDVTAFPTILTGDLDQDGPFDDQNSLHVLRSLVNDFTLDGLTVTRGQANGATTVSKRGGGVMVTDVNVQITNCRFVENYGRMGGALHAIGGAIVIEDCVFLTNRGSTGCGLRVEGSSLSVTNTTFTENQANTPGNGTGGGIHASEGSSIVVVGCSFSQASIARAGALLLDDSSAQVTGCSFSDMEVQHSAGAIKGDGSSLEVTSCTFSNLTSLNVSNSGDAGGGAIRLDSGTLVLRDCDFSDTTTGGWGGAVKTSVADGEIERCQFEDCHATLRSGGAISADISPLTLRDCEFRNCSAQEYGGALVMDQGVVEDGLFESCSAQEEAGAVRLYIGAATGVRFTRCTLRGNTSGLEGGAMYARIVSSGSLYIEDSSFENNAGRRGGGLFIDSPVPLPTVLRDARFTDNSAVWTGGGIHAFGTDLDVRGLVLARNDAAEPADGGGGAYFEDCTGAIRQATVYGNEVETGNGAGLHFDGASSPSLSDAIAWDNVAEFFPGANEQVLDGTGVLSVEYSCVQYGFFGAGNILADPLFVDAPMLDLRLEAASPCIDTGDPSSPVDPDCTRADMGAHPYDQGGLGRKLCAPAPVNSTGWPGRAAGTGSRVVADDDFGVEANQLPTGERAILLSSPTAGGAALPGYQSGTGGLVRGLCVGVPFGADALTIAVTDGSGAATFDVDLAQVPAGFGTFAAVSPGETWYFQVLYQDRGDSRVTNALAVPFE